jgi:hypothetical protein
MDSLQGWRYMMRLILAPKPTEGIKEKTTQIVRSKIRQNTSKNTKIKNIAAQGRR